MGVKRSLRKFGPSSASRRAALRGLGPRKGVGRRVGLVALLVPACLAFASTARGQAPALLVRDINEQPVRYGVVPFEIAAVGDSAFFRGCADDGATGCELWKSDGTAAGTVLVKDIAQGPEDSVPHPFLGPYPPGYWTIAELNGQAFFAACDRGTIPDYEQGNCELWRSDGTRGGTVLLKDIFPETPSVPGGSGTPSSVPASFANLNGTLYFSATDPAHGRELWKSDGTRGGTVLVKDILPGNAYSSPEQLTNVDGTLFFRTPCVQVGGCFGWDLWKSDGTAAGTVRVKGPFPGYAGDVLSESEAVNGTLFFEACTPGPGLPEEDCELWKSDGTEAGTVRVKDIAPGSASSLPRLLTNVKGTLFFAAEDGVHGLKLWKSDGTEAGTVRVTDLAPATSFWEPHFLVDLNGTAVFGGCLVDTYTCGIWRSDGTAAGTSLVTEFSYLWRPAGVAMVGGTLYFTAAGDGTGFELWKTDGTEAGTAMVKDIAPGPWSSLPENLTDVNGTLFFSAAEDPENGRELWKSDGTEAGTVLERPPVAADVSQDSAPASLTPVRRTLLFTADDGVHGRELWKSDGTPGGTALVKDILPGTGGSGTGSLTAAGRTLYFTAYDAVHGGELWKSDGTEAGTVLVKDLFPGEEGSLSGPFTHSSGTLFFAADDGVHGRELWKSDGTDGGTVLVEDIAPGSASALSPSDEMVDVGGTLFFGAGGGLWRSDGTAAGTAPVSEIAAASAFFTDVNGTLYFCSSTTFSVCTGELWKSDGTAEGTVLVKDVGLAWDFTNVDGTLFFLDGQKIWKSDGTEAGTVLVSWQLGSASDLTDVNGALFFVGCSGSPADCELWKSDGTAAGTVRVKDILPGSGSSQPGSLVEAGGTLFFTADDGVHGRELWKSDGTAEGTVLVADVIPGSGSGAPESLTAVGSLLFFSAVGEATGRELWLVAGALKDSDGDGLTDEEEIALGTDPHDPDSDDDGYGDGDEVAAGTDPLSADSIPCGNGALEDPETCDDGGTTAGDGCSATCRVEPPFVCTGEPSECSVRTGPQTREQEACIHAMNQGGARLLEQQGWVAGSCLRHAAAGKVRKLGAPPQEQTAQACLANDVSGRLRKEEGALDRAAASRCLASPSQLPDYAHAGRDAVEAAAKTAGIGLVVDLFGAPLDPVVVPRHADREAARCQRETYRRTRALLDGLWNVALEAKRDALRGMRASPEVEDSLALQLAIVEALEADARGTLARALLRLGREARRRCADLATPLALLFPSSCASATTSEDLTSCANAAARCRFCASLNAMDGLGLDCDNFDDGAANDPPSCP